MRWVDHELEDLAIGGAEMLPAAGVCAFPALAEKLNADGAEFLNSRFNVLNEKAGHHLVTRELLWRM